MRYAPKHNPMVFFQDVTDNGNPNSQNCIKHNRPLPELQTDLTSNSVARYNFITPNLCNDMHGALGCQNPDTVKAGNDWLNLWIPRIMASKAYTQGGVIFITWDESEPGSSACPAGNCPIGMIVVSPLNKGGGYSNTVAYDHSSTLKTIEEIFGVTPLLGGAANATDLRDLFTTFP